MKQLVQKLRNGQPEIVEVPIPIVSSGSVLVRNAFSVISVGTEGSTVRAARKSLLGKAQERPQQARQMLELLKQAGPVQAYRTAAKKLDSYSPMGYSCSGVVVAVGEGVTGLAVGDKVGCAGATASHADAVVVPENLCVKLAPDADLKVAAYNTLGAIALQGIRQADLRLGETCGVIGLGLLGQLTALMLRAAGNKVVGIDVDPKAVDLARTHAVDVAAQRNDVGLAGEIASLTGGIGLDAVIITAATDSTDPVNFAGEILRHRGRVVIVGAVPTGFDRDPHYYRKELDLRMSCSYGPGRYDPVYEEKNVDYPVGYVRWTERRNMQAFQDLIHSKRIDPSYLTSHTFPLADAPSAYDMILEKSAPYLGILIEYPEASLAQAPVLIPRKGAAEKTVEINVAFIGAGSYAMGNLLPNLPADSWLRRRGVMTSSGVSARSVAERFKFDFCTSTEADVFGNAEIDTIFIATRHNSHGSYVRKALAAQKRVFVEKPLCLTESELSEIERMVAQSAHEPMLMVGFNRRYSPLTDFVREKIGSGPMCMVYRVNAGPLPRESWILDAQVGGGRIIGEACHFIDYLTYLNGSVPTQVHAAAMPVTNGSAETVTINLEFANGSIGSVVYCANGAKSLPKEYVELHSGGRSAIITNFSQAEVFTGASAKKKKLMFQDKGQKAMLKVFFGAIRAGGKPPIPFDEIAAVTRSTFKVIESLVSRAALAVSPLQPPRA